MPKIINEDIKERKDHRRVLSLSSSEKSVFESVSRIYAAYVVSGQVNDDNENEMMIKAIKLATKMAEATDRYIRSDDEI